MQKRGWFSVFLLVMLMIPSVQAKERLALVMGNANYQQNKLRNPINDAKAMAKKLRALDFDVIEKHDLNEKQMVQVIRQFGERLANYKVGLFYYSGHGTQVKGKNYLLPLGANIQHEDEVSYESIDAERVLAKMESSRNGMNILILDACRDNPFQRRFKSASKGLARMDAPVGTLLVYATAPGQVADDGDQGNGLFTRHLLNHMGKEGLDVNAVLRLTRAGVLAESKQQGRQQVPWESSSLVEPFCFVRCGAVAPPEPPKIVTPQQSVEQQQPVKPVESRQAFEPEMVSIKGGSFRIGCISGKNCQDNEKVRKVQVKDFWMATTEVTVKQYQACVSAGACQSPEWLKKGSQYHIRTGSNDWYKRMGQALTGDNYPIVGVSWHDATAYAKWMKDQTGKAYRLPTEAEWEIAARAGSETVYPWGNIIGKNKANCYGDYCGDQYEYTAPVASFKAYNGLYDMHGNVWEWTCSAYEKNYNGSESVCTNANDSRSRVLRGGSWYYVPQFVRSAYRYRLNRTGRDGYVGFRLARTR